MPNAPKKKRAAKKKATPRKKKARAKKKAAARKPGRPRGAKTKRRPTVDGARTKCPRCGSTERGNYANRREVAYAGIDLGGGSNAKKS